MYLVNICVIYIYCISTVAFQLLNSLYKKKQLFYYSITRNNYFITLLLGTIILLLYNKVINSLFFCIVNLITIQCKYIYRCGYINIYI